MAVDTASIVAVPPSAATNVPALPFANVDTGSTDIPTDGDLYLVTADHYPTVADHLAAHDVRAPVIVVITDELTPRVEADLGHLVTDVIRPDDPASVVTARIRNALRTVEAATRDEQLTLALQTIHAVDMGITVVDRTGAITRLNEPFLALTGYDREAVIGGGVDRLFGPATDPDAAATVRDAIASREETTVELRCHRPDGTTFWNELTVRPTTGDEVLTFHRDVTGRKDRESKIERYVDLKRTVGELANIGGWEYDKRENSLWWTDSTKRIHRVEMAFTPDVETAIEFYHPDDRDLVRETFETVLETGQTMDFETRLIRNDGEVRWVHSYGTPIRDDGEIVGARGTIQDITTRKEREHELERYEAIVRTATDPIFTLDEEGLVTSANPATSAILGVAHDDLIGAPMAQFVSEQAASEAEATIDALIAGEETEPYTVAIETIDGTRYYEVSVAELAQAGRFTGTVNVSRDVTAIHEYEQRLSVFDRLLRHNIRNKLNIVLSYGELAKEHTDDEAASGYIDRLLEAGEALLDISETVRQFKDSIDPDRLRTTEHDLAAVTAVVVDELEIEYPHADIVHDLPASAVAISPELPELVVNELIENAIIHNDGDPQVDVQVTVENDAVVLRVADNGPGLPPVERQTLEGDVETPLQHSTGVGLWMTRWAVERVGGVLSFDTDGTTGTAVTIRFPRRVEAK